MWERITFPAYQRQRSSHLSILQKMIRQVRDDKDEKGTQKILPHVRDLYTWSDDGLSVQSTISELNRHLTQVPHIVSHCHITKDNQRGKQQRKMPLDKPKQR